ncbi:methyl-accepting chemotaxis protein [Eubacteriales bacterium OttesenSCG-928-K08]|nr:methyl-accepting chemotaxis protein [Eubacteriales bacterium OttesenSCG-928-K08]
MKAIKKSIAAKLFAVLITMLVLSSVVIGVIGFVLYRDGSVDFSVQRVETIAETIVAMISPEEFAQIMESGEKNEYWYTTKAIVDDIKERTDTAYIYIMDNPHGGNNEFTYFMEGYTSNEKEPEIDLWHKEEASVHADEVFETLRTGKSMSTDFYQSGEFGVMVSGYAAIKDSSGSTIGVVGVDAPVEQVLAASRRYSLLIAGIIVAYCIICAFLCFYITRRLIGRPIQEITLASEKIADGDITVELSATNSQDEIGQLTEAFRRMAENTKKQAAVMEAIANKDMTVEITPRCENDVMSYAMQRMTENMNAMFLEIHKSTLQISSGSAQIADGAQMLAQGATEQEITISQLAESIGHVAERTEANTKMAQRATELAGTIRQAAEKGSVQMEEMLSAVRDIDRANQAIGKVMKLIDDIAFQTNLLALNAAVEAARAGQYGKGFAVVADEVRNLAAKSAKSAKDTAELIEDSIQKAALGVSIAKDTSKSLHEIVEGINESGVVIANIFEASEEQSTAISLINTSVGEVAMVVEQNSATAEQSAASSEQMSSQCESLENSLQQFNLKDNWMFG